jgi:hypothetical protein
MRGWILVAAATLLAAGCAPPEDRADVEALEAELAALEQENARLAEENLALEDEVEQLRAQLEEDEPVAPEVGEPAPPRTDEGLIDQLRAHFPPAEDAPEGWELEATDWYDTDVPQGFGEAEAAFDTPGALVTALAAAVEGATLGGADGAWEVIARVAGEDGVVAPDADEATGALLVFGYLDDSVAGRDLRLHLERGGDGWYVAAAEERLWCQRGATEIDGRPGCV